MLAVELARLRSIRNEFSEIYEMQDQIVEGLGMMLEDLDIGEVQDLIE